MFKNIRSTKIYHFCFIAIKMAPVKQILKEAMQIYQIAANNKDPEITLKVPAALLRDLALRSEENGNSIEVELALRLARSLERDFAMIEEDNALAFAAFEKMVSSSELE